MHINRFGYFLIQILFLISTTLEEKPSVTQSIRLIDHEHLIHSDVDNSRVLKLFNVFNHTNIFTKVNKIDTSWSFSKDFCTNLFEKNGYLRLKFQHFNNKLCYDNYTSLYSNQDDGTVLLVTHFPLSPVLIYGIINEIYSIKPDWNRLKDNSVEHGSYHSIVEIEQTVSSLMGYDVSQLMKNIAAVHKRNQLINSNKRIIYPEITIVVDYSTFNIHQNVDELWRYLNIFVHRIDLLFKQLTFPLIRIRLNDIVIATNPFPFQYQQPFVSEELNQRRKSKRPLLNAFNAIVDFGFTFYQQKLSNSDIILVITGDDLCLSNGYKQYNYCSYSTVKGHSFVGGACRQDDFKKRKINLAIVEDNGLFDGVLVAAHEIGHLLGSVHDGEWPLNGILGPGGRGCATNIGYLMSGINSKFSSKKNNTFLWSVCSVEQFQYFMRLPQSTCLYNRPL